ncbi:uncharacterized protein LY79DRAFT_553322 [Colletotrichum navitas]|uniref:Uncharacterized protein n=1 Tax=Colletotrichum navitas TaxID=681940 RepID=A0AAD8PZ82_9PEZI|nr:uncharacterized protein LY79DRAFT_553322 [Colletotrichum navitas]KAK1590849.1 hypothetical protein LY79DRAFT_553322 [Colletotrichum navitas]
MKLLSAPNHIPVLLLTASSSPFGPDCPALGNYPMVPSCIVIERLSAARPSVSSLPIYR